MPSTVSRRARIEALLQQALNPETLQVADDSAAHAGHGAIVLTKVAIWSEGLEKVLGVPRSFAQTRPETLQALLRAMMTAADWCRAPAHREELIDILSRANRLNLPARDIGAALHGEIPMADGSSVAIDPFGDESALRPDVGAAGWFYDQMVLWGQTGATSEGRAAAEAAYRPDLLPGGTSPPACAPGGFFDHP